MKRRKPTPTLLPQLPEAPAELPPRAPELDADERAELADQATDQATTPPLWCPRQAPDCPAVPENGARYCARCVARV